MSPIPPEYLPYTFRQAKLGPLVGRRIWGGLVGIAGYPPLIHGGTVMAARMGIWFPNGRWDVENRGVAPDMEGRIEKGTSYIILVVRLEG
jgi:tricorn protease